MKLVVRSRDIIGKASLPSTLKAMQDMESDSGIPFPECFYDVDSNLEVIDAILPLANKVSSSPVVSCNLKNGSHYNVWIQVRVTASSQPKMTKEKSSIGTLFCPI